MKILYVARHSQTNSNDDEGAVAFALEKMGHEVIRLPEQPRTSIYDKWPTADFCLFHKWGDVTSIREIKTVMPCVFWYFDLVDWPLDPTLASRCEARKRWMAEVTPLVDLGFMTDGDHVAKDTTGKLRVLRQGADERVVGFGTKQGSVYDTDVLFVGGVKRCGVQRESFLTDLQERYKGRFMQVGKGVYGRSLANLIASAKVVVCPDSPVTSRYCSNRVFVLGGFGAFLVHPKSYVWDIPSLVMYDDRKQMFQLIDAALECPEKVADLRNTVLEQVKSKHLYLHRCEELVRVVKERLYV